LFNVNASSEYVETIVGTHDTIFLLIHFFVGRKEFVLETQYGTKSLPQGVVLSVGVDNGYGLKNI